ncbi:MAG: hypothetical protein MUC50_08800 [Myxococcota bacterium]|jgi:hypothetical protein|nr:hypothetical protein [Myxococcota bacterium]
MKTIISPFILLFALLCAGGCTANQSVKIDGRGKGTATLKIEVQKLFADYFKGEEGGKVFDTAKIKQGMEKRRGFKVTRIASPTPETLEMDLAFEDIRSLFSNDNPPDNDGIVRITEKDGKTNLSFHLDRAAAKELGNLFSDVSNPAFREMSPRKQRTRTQAEYLEAIEFAVGKEGPPLMKASFIKITLIPDGKLVSQAGGKVEGDAVVFEVPILRVMMLEKPLAYAVTFIPAKTAAPKKKAKAK